jgi:copper chaperone NosL
MEKTKKFSMKKVKMAIAALVAPLILVSCSSGVKPINYGKDNCDHCKMTIVDNKFGVEIISNTGKTFKMDDLVCAHGFINDQVIPPSEIKAVYVNNYLGSGELHDIKTMTIVRDEELKTPMGGSLAAFVTKEEAENYLQSHDGEIVTLERAVGIK